MQPFIKWPGGKQEELKVIKPNMPKYINKYIEPFVGGGAVYLEFIDNNNIKEYLINDKSQELINLYQCIKKQDLKFFKKLRAINQNWILLGDIVEKHAKELIDNYIDYKNNKISDETYKNYLINFVEENSSEFEGLLESDFNINIENFIKEIKRNLTNKTKRMKKIEGEKGELPKKDILDNFESAFKSAFYMHFRHLYNHIDKYNLDKPFATAIFYFIREYCYSSMFRYNKTGQFNVPYGGISYNRKDFRAKIDRLSEESLVAHLKRTTIECMDFEDFLNQVKPKEGDFIFLDPPYDTDFSTYAKNTFDQDDQIRLANYLKTTKANFMLIIKNTDFIYSLYSNCNLNIRTFDKKYMVSFQNRNDKKAKHLLITNY